jgi:fucokinase
VAVGLRSRRATVHLSDGRIAYQVPVTLDGLAGRATVLLGVDDDPKQSRGATLLGAAFTEWTGARGLDAELVWEGVPAQHRTLWNARVFPVIGARADPAESLDWLESGKGKSAHRRLSLAEIQGAFDARRWFAHETRIRSELSAREIAGALRENDAPVDRLAAGVPRPLRAPVLQALARHAARSTDRLQSARLWRGCAALAGVSDVGSEYHQRAFHSISVGLSEQVGAVPARRWNSVPGTMVEGSAPVRLDLAGGWTDTPPQACTEGGSVLNVALTLDGKLPLLARARILAEPVLRFIARDLRLERVCGTRAEVEACRDPADPFALHKAAVLEAGLVTPDVAGTLEELLLGAGGGLELETDSQVPKGSGLGTSSILGGVVLGCLFRLLDAGEPGGPDWRRLFGAVLRLEQRMTTGGGWQDQVGGLLPGFKLTQTGPGWDQTPSLFEVECAPEVRAELQARLVLFYTGLPRLARNVLQRVIDRYLAGEPVAIATLNRMRVLSHELREALVRGDLVQVGAGMTESWALNKRLEPTASNPEIEAIFAAAAPYVLGGKLAGAGGGGFAAFLTRSSQDAAELVTVLEKACPGGRCYPATISSSGLELRVCGAVAS